MFEAESEICVVSTRYNLDLHRPAADLTVCQKRVDCVGGRVYNKLPFKINVCPLMVNNVK